jgi:brefeldin A-inhibited guanine nucleotide-exchange protein
MFGVFSAASKVLTGWLFCVLCPAVTELTFSTEKVVTSAFEIVTRLNRDHFAAIVNNGSFADLTVCITEYCKVSKYQKISLLAIAMLRNTIPTMLKSQDVSLKSDGSTVGGTEDEPTMKYWFPVLFGFYDIIMNGEDLEIRRL